MAFTRHVTRLGPIGSGQRLQGQQLTVVAIIIDDDLG